MSSKIVETTTTKVGSRNVNKPLSVSSSTSNARLGTNATIETPAPDTVKVENNEVTAEQEKKIVNEFVYLLDKSKQLFNGLKWVIVSIVVFIFVYK